MKSPFDLAPISPERREQLRREILGHQRSIMMVGFCSEKKVAPGKSARMTAELQRPGVAASLIFPEALVPVEAYELTVAMRPVVSGLALASPVDFRVLGVCVCIHPLQPIVLTMQNSTKRAQILRACLAVEDVPPHFDFYLYPGPGPRRD